MSIETWLNRYRLVAKAGGQSPRTIDHVSRCVGFFTRFMGGIPDISKVTADDLRRFILGLQEKPKGAGSPHSGQKLSATSVNTYVRAIKGFWAWLKREGIIKEDPLSTVATPKLPQWLPKVITEEQLTAVFKAVASNRRETALLLLLLDTGITLSELEGLDDNDVDLRDLSAKVFRQKTEKERYVYFCPQTAAAIDAYRFVRPQPVAQNRLLLTADGRPLTGKRIQKILELVGKKAGISQRLSPHKLRHSFATWSLKYGSNLEYIRIILGHSDIRTTSRFYLHAANAEVATAHQRFSPVANLGIRNRRPRLRHHEAPETAATLSPQELKSLLLRGPNPPGKIFEVDYDPASHVLVATETVIKPGQTIEHRKARVI